MNDYSYESLEVGHEEHFQRVVTAEMLDDFCRASGDVNPLHCDEQYAVGLGFAGRVAYGMLTASLYSTLAGVWLPGKHCLLHSVDSSFRKPVFIGDTLTVSGVVDEKNDDFRIITVKATVTNQKGEKVSKAKIQLGFI